MKLTLESDEIIRILAKHFNIRADSCKITLKKKPFEIELSGIPMEDDAPRPREPRAPLEPVPAERAFPAGSSRFGQRFPRCFQGKSRNDGHPAAGRV